MDRNRSLTRREFDEVIRRATELAANETESADLTEAELYRIAQDVGLSEGHVRKALVEVRTGGLAPRPTNIVDRVFGPQAVTAARVVPGLPAELASGIDEFLVAGRLLQPVRRSEHVLQYRPAVDWASQIARAASSTSRRYYVASAKSVEVRLDPTGEDDRTLVEFIVDPGTRGDSIGGAAVGGVMLGGGAGFGVGVLILGAAPFAVAVGAGALVAGGVAAGMTALVGKSHQKKMRDVRMEVEGILDRLEMGDGLEPPPPSWRRWVKRNFHGARKLLGDDDEGFGG